MTSEDPVELEIRLIERETTIERLGAHASRLQAELDASRAEADALRDRAVALEAALLSAGASLADVPAGTYLGPGGAAAVRLAPPPRPWPELHASEAAVQRTFVAAYGPGDEEDAATASRPSPVDRAGTLVATHEGRDGPSVDVVVCVHDALEDVRACLWSLVHKTARPFRLILVNDGSGSDTTRFLEEVARAQPAVTLVHNDRPPHGYTIAVNLGLRRTTADYVVLLNSDTVVTFGWLDRIVAHGERDQRAGILGPLSNAASHQSVPALRDADGWATNPLPAWLTPDGLALAVTRTTGGATARLPFINGFCYVVRRAVVDALGEFDEERFASGYCEENDYSQRARDAGFLTAVVDDAYVFHAKSKSFGVDGRRAIAAANYETFLDKHGRARVTALVGEMERDTTLDPRRDAVARAIGDPSSFADAVVGGGPPPLSIVFVLPGISEGGSGGSHSVYQEVRGLRALGVPARIAVAADAMDRVRRAYADADEVFEPYRDAADLQRRTHDGDVIVATHNASVELLAEIRGQRDDVLPAYYVQDYEPLFTLADPAAADRALASYTAIPDVLLFAKTHWLCNVVGERHGLYVAKVEPSIDADVYVPGGAPAEPDVLRVTAMIRPRTPRRQPFSTLHVLERLAEDFPGRVAITTFGCTDEALAKVDRSPEVQARHRGILSRDGVADLLRATDVFLDMSTYQAFGRTALEAMACGATAVVPRVGGAWEFAREDENAILVDTLDRQASYDALAVLVDDPARVHRLRAGARETAARFSVARAALSEYVLFEHEHRRRFGDHRARDR